MARQARRTLTMYLLYVDEPGDTGIEGSDPLVLAGAALFDGKWRWIRGGLLPGKYVATWPVFIVGDRPDALSFSVTVDDAEGRAVMGRRLRPGRSEHPAGPLDRSSSGVRASLANCYRGW